MSKSHPPERQQLPENNDLELQLDSVPTSQPELGPNILDGGYGFIVFLATLFFQTLVPSLIVNFGIFIPFAKLQHGIARETNPKLWDEGLIKVPLLYLITKTLIDGAVRTCTTSRTKTKMISFSPRLVSTSGICLICAGLLFLWIGMTGRHDDWLFGFAGIIAGLGSALVIVICELQMGHYFRIRLPILSQISYAFTTLGFAVTPIIIGKDILEVELSHVILWYQAAIMQLLIIGLVFRLPPYLKQKQTRNYKFLSVMVPEEEEDNIFSKNSKELQIRRQNSETVSKIALDEATEAGASSSGVNWVKFDEEAAKNTAKPTFISPLHEPLDLSDKEDDPDFVVVKSKENWEKFESEPSPKIYNSLSVAEETGPSSLFSDSAINNNNTYSFDDEGAADNHNSSVFMPNQPAGLRDRFTAKLLPFKQLTFYKSLATIISNKYSTFVLFCVFPSHLYAEIESFKLPMMARAMGLMALPTLAFYLISYVIPRNKQINALFFAFYNLLSFMGYFMIADTRQGYVLIWGGAQVYFSLCALDYYGKMLFGVSLKGEVTEEYKVLNFMAGLALCLFLFIDPTYKTCFRMMAMLQFFVGTLWLSNFVYSRIGKFQRG